MIHPRNRARRPVQRPALALLGALLSLALGACAPETDLVIYCALDQVHSEPLLRRFESETGLRVRAEFDVEANKTVGLVQRLRAERNRTRCDVFWNNEIAHTVALGEEGLLAPHDSPSAADIPEAFRDPERRWTGFAARARVFIVNTELADPATIRGMADLFDPAWAGKVGMARPLSGTTLTHMGALPQVVGEAAAREYVETAKRLNEEGQLALTSGNATLMRQVRDGKLAFGWTDTDDYNVARETGAPVAVVYPDQQEGGVGTLLIPNTVAILADAPHPDAARRFVDWVLRPTIEEELAASRSAQIPVRASVPRPEHVADLSLIRVMQVDFLQVGRELPARHEAFKELFVD